MKGKRTVIAIQGHAGSYHDQARKKQYPDSEMLGCDTFLDVFQAVQNANAEYGIVAIANNRYGFIPEPYLLMLNDAGKSVQIVGEVYLSIKHQLLGLPGTTLAGIKELHSQPPALGQCGNFIRENLADAVVIEELDTALAAKKVAERNDLHAAAIASREAADLYNLSLIAEDIQDDENNLTRFLIISKTPPADATENTKTSIILETGNAPGSLADALQEFKQFDINIDLLHSTFVANSDFTMRFFLEYDTGWHSSESQQLLRALTVKHEANITLLGSYQAATNLQKDTK